MKYWVGPFLICFATLSTSAAAEVDFSHDVVPVLKQYCGKCHTGDQKKGGLSVNTRELLLVGGESGKVVVVGKSGESDLLARLTTDDKSLRMPPDGPAVPADKVALIKRWIDEGLAWDKGFSFGKRNYEPPLKPRRPELPPAVDGRDNPIDRIIDAYLTQKKIAHPQPIDDSTFVRRVYLDIIGLLPTAEELQAFQSDSRPDKRTRLVQELLHRDVHYAEHWLTFFNDLLRNDYSGTGFVTNGRKQISKWLYQALVANKPYDQMARELIAPPTVESAGFADGIRWRGDVSAGQTVEIQFAQSVGQSLLGINLKCASCHDSFIDRWKLEESYGLAAIYSNQPLQIHRCDKPIGKTAQASWLFPELGQVDAKAPQLERLKQLAALMTHPENGRFARTIVNRIWHRMIGRAIVHPPDAMQTEPWNADLLDYLAVHLADNHYDLKTTIELIATSQAYQSQSQVVAKGADDQGYVFAGPRAKRLTAEQFVDCIWELTGTAPTRYDAPLLRGKPDPEIAQRYALTGKWIWSREDVAEVPANETVVFRKTWEVKVVPGVAVAVISCDNSYTFYLNGQRLQAGENWQVPDMVLLSTRLKGGPNEIMIVAKNGGASPNPAGLFFEAWLYRPDGGFDAVATDATWQWTSMVPDANGKYATAPTDWKPAALALHPEVWSASLNTPLLTNLAQGAESSKLMVRAGLVKSDFLMRSLGRPNRDQIVSVRPSDLSTLEATDLSNGQILADTLARGSQNLLTRSWESPAAFIRWLYRSALSRDPSAEELQSLTETLGDKMTEQGIQDVLWAVAMLPEFQLVR